MSLVSYGESSGSESEEEQSRAGSKDVGETKDVRKLLSVLPAPVKGGKRRVQVGVPRLRAGTGVSHSQ